MYINVTSGARLSRYIVLHRLIKAIAILLASFFFLSLYLIIVIIISLTKLFIRLAECGRVHVLSRVCGRVFKRYLYCFYRFSFTLSLPLIHPYFFLLANYSLLDYCFNGQQTLILYAACVYVYVV